MAAMSPRKLAGVFLLIAAGGLAVAMVIQSSGGAYTAPWAWQNDDTEWGSAWLVLWGLSYLLAAGSLSAIIIATDRDRGVAWAVACSTIGASMFCVYFALRVTRTRTLSLAPGKATSDAEDTGACAVRGSQVVLGAAGTVFFGIFVLGNLISPLLPPAPDDTTWVVFWAWVTCCDVTTCAIVACTIVWWTEEAAKAAAWSALFIPFGGMGVAAYVALQLLASDEWVALASGADGKTDQRVEMTDPGLQG